MPFLPEYFGLSTWSRADKEVFNFGIWWVRQLHAVGQSFLVQFLGFKEHFCSCSDRLNSGDASVDLLGLRSQGGQYHVFESVEAFLFWKIVCWFLSKKWKVSRIFMEFDADGSGELSVEELESFLKVGACRTTELQQVERHEAWRSVVRAWQWLSPFWLSLIPKFYHTSSVSCLCIYPCHPLLNKGFFLMVYKLNAQEDVLKSLGITPFRLFGCNSIKSSSHFVEHLYKLIQLKF